MLTPFDLAVIAYAQSRGESSEAVYRRLEDGQYRAHQTEAQLLAKLDRLKVKETTQYELPYGIKVAVNGKSGSVESALHEGYEFDDLPSKAAYELAVDALESLILAHACAGIDIASPAYVEGVETAVGALLNHCT